MKFKISEKKIIEIDFEQLMNQLIIRIMNHKKNRFRQNSKSFKTESISDLKFDDKNNLNSNSNSRRLKTDDKEKKKFDDCFLTHDS